MHVCLRVFASAQETVCECKAVYFCAGVSLCECVCLSVYVCVCVCVFVCTGDCVC